MLWSYFSIDFWINIYIYKIALYDKTGKELELGNVSERMEQDSELRLQILHKHAYHFESNYKKTTLMVYGPE